MGRQVTVSARALVTVGVVAVALVAAYLVGHAGGGGQAQAAEEEPAGRTVTVQGVGHVSVVPDQLGLSLGVAAERPDLGDALDQAGAAVEDVVDALVAQGVDRADVQTTGMSVYPTYSRKPRAITGYRVDQSLSVVVRDLDRASDVVQAAVSAGGPGVHLDDLRLQVGDPDAALAPARSAAYDQAVAKAQEYADSVGGDLGDVVRLSDAAPASGLEQGLDYSTADAAASVPIQAGQSELTASVTVVFALG